MSLTRATRSSAQPWGRALATLAIVWAALLGSAMAQSAQPEAPQAPAPAAPATAPTATSVAPPVLPAMTAPDPALVARIAALKTERSAIRLGTPIGLVAGGLGLFLAGAALGVQTLLYSEAVGFCGYAGCLTTPVASALGGTAAALGVAGIVLISIGAPMLRARLRARRALSEELRQLSQPRLAFDLRPAQAGLTLRAKF